MGLSFHNFKKEYHSSLPAANCMIFISKMLNIISGDLFLVPQTSPPLFSEPIVFLEPFDSVTFLFLFLRINHSFFSWFIFPFPLFLSLWVLLKPCLQPFPRFPTTASSSIVWASCEFYTKGWGFLWTNIQPGAHLQNHTTIDSSRQTCQLGTKMVFIFSLKAAIRGRISHIRSV